MIYEFVFVGAWVFVLLWLVYCLFLLAWFWLFVLFNCINSVDTCGSLLVDLLFGDFLPARCFGWCLFSLVAVG